MGKRVISENSIDVYYKPMADNYHAIVYLNKNSIGSGTYVSYPLSKILPATTLPTQKYAVMDTFTNALIAPNVGLDYQLELKVNPSGVQMVTLWPKLC